MGQRFELAFQAGKDIKKAVMDNIKASYPEILDEKLGYTDKKEMPDGSILVKMADIKNADSIVDILRHAAPEEAEDENSAYHVAYIGDEGFTGEAWNGEDYFNIYRTIHTPLDDKKTFRYSILGATHGGTVEAFSKETAMDLVIDAYREESDIQLTDEDVEIFEDVSGLFSNGVREVY